MVPLPRRITVVARGSCILALLLLAPGPIRAVLLEGDLDGSGAVNAADEGWLRDLFGSQAGDGSYDPAGDLDADGRVDFVDLARFGKNFGASGGTPDTTPPALFVTLNDIPDDMNDLLVTPPDGFQITLQFASAGGSVVDTSSLSVTSDHAIGAYAPGAELAGLFTTSPTRAVFEVPVGTALSKANHVLTVGVRDAAGNLTSATYPFAVRQFPYGPPFGALQTFYLDFGQDRSLGAGVVDFVEDLREFGLSTASAPAIEAQMRDRLVSEITARANGFYGRNPDGSPGADPVNLQFVAQLPAGAHSRLCVGGQSSLGAPFLGASTLDVNNLNDSDDECAPNAQFGVFPAALDNLWGANAEYQQTFSPLDPGLGGTPVGAHALDSIVTAPGFDPETATAAQIARWSAIEDAVDGFAWAVSVAVAHETGHLVGLVAHDAAPAGLYGGSSGANTDHNVTVQGYTPGDNWIMNQGGAFTFDEITGRNGNALPTFRALNWAYLRDRIALSTAVTGFYDPPAVTSVSPNPVSFPPGQQNVAITITGDAFFGIPIVELITEGDPTPNPVQNVTVLNSQTILGTINKWQVPPATYDVHVINPDDQEATLVDGLVRQ
jgi:hypothetical protein